MSTENLVALYVFGPIVLLLIGAAIVDFEHKRKKPNIRVPKETLWERTNRFHSRPDTH